MYHCQPAFYPGKSVGGSRSLYLIMEPEHMGGSVYVNWTQVKALGKVQSIKFDSAEALVASYEEWCDEKHGGHISPQRAPPLPFTVQIYYKYMHYVGYNGVYKGPTYSNLPALARARSPPASHTPHVQGSPPFAPRSGTSGVQPPLAGTATERRTALLRESLIRAWPDRFMQADGGRGNAGAQTHNEESLRNDADDAETASACSIDDNDPCHVITADGRPPSLVVTWPSAHKMRKNLEAQGFTNVQVHFLANKEEREAFLMGTY
ncbi:hypothetical protein BD626DRAFT_579506 [Schizophyllum amplum]|uniref:Uncharacterized protein n=1 Tax=Schizophyllum amplum TaxID=97359 RepID=A0A550BRH8_9AGAR|nr:hypothetical protein BD626DRAFT_579506 [Auriculariopsis ampla]